MGQQLIKSVNKNKTFNLVALTERVKINKKFQELNLNLTQQEHLKRHL